MSRSATLLAYVSQLTQDVANLNLLTNITAVVPLYSGGLSQLPSPGIGVYLSPPMPTAQSMLVHGAAAYDLWQITLFISLGNSANQQEGLLTALDVASVLRNQIGHGFNYPDLMPDPDSPISIIENTPSSTIVAVHYVYPFTL